MRIALIADMHGNAVAFEAALKDLDRVGYDQIVCLGDGIQSGPQPAECLALLRDRKIPTVMGNTDDWLLKGYDFGKGKIPAEEMAMFYAVRDWSLSRLTDADKAFIAAFEPNILVDLGNGEKLLCFHGTPDDFDGILLPEMPIEKYREALPTDKANYFAGGHVHIQFLRQVGQAVFVNPGSVGMPFRNRDLSSFPLVDPVIEYAVLTVENRNVSFDFRRLPLDVDRLVDVYRSSGRPYMDQVLASFENG